MSLAPVGKAQVFSYTNNDLALGFRKTSVHIESFEAVVNIGSATNYVNLELGTTITVPNFTPDQLSPDTFSDLNFLSWSVSGFAKTNTLFVLPGYVNNTLWLTVPRSNPSTSLSRETSGSSRASGTSGAPRTVLPHRRRTSVSALRPQRRCESRAQRALLKLVFAPLAMGRPVLGPPGLAAVPREILRNAFDAMMKDAAVLADARKTNLELYAPMTGDAVSRLIEEMHAQDPALVRAAAEMMRSN
jgi:hypothetical protein